MRRHERIDRLVGEHAARLSERLQQHRAQLFPPNARKEMRKFAAGEVADLLGVKDSYLRKLHLDGKAPDVEMRGNGRRYYTSEDIQALRVQLEKGAKVPGTYRPGRRDGDHLQVVTVINFKGGSGKTTTIGKIASKLTEQGAKALLVAGDTFRAAAIEQLTVWGERAGIPVMSKPTGADAAGLVYEAMEQAKADDLDLVLVDTAGRLQNKAELMAELEKVVRVVRKLDPTAPHDVILVLDATVGQNALSQVEAFRNTAGVTGLVMTKLDGTAKGGVLVAIAEAFDLPIHFIGIGEKAEDLRPFSAEAFSKALVGIQD